VVEFDGTRDKGFLTFEMSIFRELMTAIRFNGHHHHG
jgi:hypothetical protein